MNAGGPVDIDGQNGPDLPVEPASRPRRTAPAWLRKTWQTAKHAAEVGAPILSALAALAAVIISVATLASASASQNSQAFSSSASALSEKDATDPRSQEAQHLGGIFGLQGVMEGDSRRQPAVVAVLASFIQAHQRTEAQNHDSFWTQPSAGCGPRPGAVQNSAPSTEVQAAFDALASRDPGEDSPRAQLDLSTTCLGYLPGADAQLPRARLTGADLKNATLTRANLEGINGVSVNLAGADLTGAVLTNADLRAANLSGKVDATGATLTGARLSGASLRGIDLSQADLTGATLAAREETDEGIVCNERPDCGFLAPADLSDARLDGTDLTGVDLTGVPLVRASMIGAQVDAAQVRRLDPVQAAQVSVD